MSNKQLLVAVSLGLESLGHVVDHLIEQETAADRKEIRSEITSLLGKVFGKDNVKVEEVAPDAAPEAPVTDNLAKILDLLNDERYTLRKLSTIAEETDLSQGDVLYELDSNSIDYVTRTKINSGAKLIGLKSRN